MNKKRTLVRAMFVLSASTEGATGCDNNVISFEERSIEREKKVKEAAAPPSPSSFLPR